MVIPIRRKSKTKGNIAKSHVNVSSNLRCIKKSATKDAFIDATTIAITILKVPKSR
jgi:hypothetical protein